MKKEEIDKLNEELDNAKRERTRINQKIDILEKKLVNSSFDPDRYIGKYFMYCNDIGSTTTIMYVNEISIECKLIHFEGLVIEMGSGNKMYVADEYDNIFIDELDKLEEITREYFDKLRNDYKTGIEEYEKYLLGEK